MYLLKVTLYLLHINKSLYVLNVYLSNIFIYLLRVKIHLFNITIKPSKKYTIKPTQGTSTKKLMRTLYPVDKNDKREDVEEKAKK